MQCFALPIRCCHNALVSKTCTRFKQTSIQRHFVSDGRRSTVKRNRRGSAEKKWRQKDSDRRIARDKKVSVKDESKTRASSPSLAGQGGEIVHQKRKIFQWMPPLRYSSTGSTYSQEELTVLAQRLPLWLLFFVLLKWEETSPFSIIQIHGPSMLPTMAPDGRDLWLRSTGSWWRLLGMTPSYRVGDLVGFCHPNYPKNVSCKRIVGVAGDRVQRYGQYVHLYVKQDPEHWGIVWPSKEDANDNFYSQPYDWIDPSCSWDQDYCFKDRQQESRRTLVVPDDHVWVEADCPGLGIDSRHFGPIPVEWLRGKIVSRVWPLYRSKQDPFLEVHGHRPHPVPLDEENLRRFNVHRIANS